MNSAGHPTFTSQGPELPPDRQDLTSPDSTFIDGQSLIHAKGLHASHVVLAVRRELESGRRMQPENERGRNFTCREAYSCQSQLGVSSIRGVYDWACGWMT